MMSMGKCFINKVCFCSIAPIKNKDVEAAKEDKRVKCVMINL
jgi:hypothetical protein